MPRVGLAAWQSLFLPRLDKETKMVKAMEITVSDFDVFRNDSLPYTCGVTGEE